MCELKVQFVVSLARVTVFCSPQGVSLLVPKAPASKGLQVHDPHEKFSDLGSLKSQSCLSATLELLNGVRLLA